jgi:hypothetical protein
MSGQPTFCLEHDCQCLLKSSGVGAETLLHLASAWLFFWCSVPFRDRPGIDGIHNRLGIQQIWRIEAFRELIIDRSQQIKRLDVAALPLPEARQIAGRAQFPATRLLAPSNLYALHQQAFNFAV